jgi:hypothetical protein
MIEELIPCQIWTGAKNKAGYGVTWHNNKWFYAHRAAVNAKAGEVVRHICDNPSCVNPMHLKIGTAKENSEDMVAKQRQAYGENAGNSKLNAHDVLAIRQLKWSRSSRDVAKMFNISKTNVLDIWKRNTWKHL